MRRRNKNVALRMMEEEYAALMMSVAESGQTQQSFIINAVLGAKVSGRMYAHNIISWHEDEPITPEQALEFGKEFAEQWFDGFQSLVGVHIDRNHVHCHIVTNSVSYTDGHKLHNTKKDLQRMKDFTNQMCMERGLSVAQKGRDFHGNELEQETHHVSKCRGEESVRQQSFQDIPS